MALNLKSPALPIFCSGITSGTAVLSSSMLTTSDIVGRREADKLVQRSATLIMISVCFCLPQCLSSRQPVP